MIEKGFDFALETEEHIYNACFLKRIEGDYAEYDSDISEADAIVKAALLAVMKE